MQYFYLLYLSHSISPYISLCFLLELLFYVSCCAPPLVVALLVLVCFKAISHIVTGSPQVMTECILGLFTSWCSELISLSVSVSLSTSLSDLLLAS